MKIKSIAAVVILTAVFLFTPTLLVQGEESTQGPGNLFALSAVLMDGDTGRVLYEKEGETPRPNASTTKVLTCVLALENASGDDYVMVSENAAAQPEVKLGLREGEQYYLEDLLYAMMLKSYNDAAVAIAEHIGGSEEGFARMMNEKAAAIGCTDTYFITANGLDARDDKGDHHTTAKDLGRIMRYAIQSETFLKITQTRDYSFSDISGKRQFSVHNANALLDMMDGVLAGKTGFTGNAGYCYVCACRVDGKIFIVSLLGCGWPNNKNYKWVDTKALLSYGNENYFYRNLYREPSMKKLPVKNGVVSLSTLGQEASLYGSVMIAPEDKKREFLVRKDENIQWRITLPKNLEAPVKQGENIGKAALYLSGEEMASYPILAEKQIHKITYMWYVDRVFHDYFH